MVIGFSGRVEVIGCMCVEDVGVYVRISSRINRIMDDD